jgi:GNAT superfamily N-acetyltransferase
MTLIIRRASRDDLGPILALMRRSLGWTDVSPRFLEWKHCDNPFGESLMWVALDGDRPVAFRAFLRWELRAPDGRVLRVVRAVDTATDPDHRRQGLFRRLTEDALDAMAGDQIAMVWNTPNPASLSGYRSMGWHELGRLPVAAMPASARFPVVVTTAKRAAGRDAVPTSFGVAAWEVFGHDSAIDGLLAHACPGEGLATRRTPEFLAWRYGNPALGYRALAADGGTAAGLAVFRLRQRGRAVEAVVCDVLVPDATPSPGSDRPVRAASGAAVGSAGVRRALLRRIARETKADYLLRIDRRRVTRGPFVRLPALGPVFACRPLDGNPPPALGEWALTMGDVELF